MVVLKLHVVLKLLWRFISSCTARRERHGGGGRGAGGKQTVTEKPREGHRQTGRERVSK